ncbi:FNDC3B [Scenedesmus sp. PABB004]|nr:FNDC3B [Scenedesmus sp. PABB004]
MAAPSSLGGAPSAARAAHQGPDGLGEEPERVLVPLAPVIDVRAPELAALSFTTAGFRWTPAAWSLPPHHAEQAAFQAEECTYTLEYELQVQQVPLGPPTPAAGPDQLLEQVPGALVDGAWRAVASGAGALEEMVQVTGLRSGRFYAARVVATACATVSGTAQQVCFPAAGSPVLPFRTRPSPPGQMQAPALAQRARNALKLKWTQPDETGGEAILRYELAVSPQPASWEGGPPDEQGFSQAYLGDERSFKLARLGPGQRFSFRIRPFSALGAGPWSLPSTFTTQASVPAAPEPPLQVGCSKDAATLQWRAPPDNGAPVSSYTLEMDDGRGGDFRLAAAGPATSASLTNLASGLTYRIRLRAENSEGVSLWSPVVAATTAATVPASPTGLGVVGITRTSVTVAWQPPHADGGSPVQGFQVQLQAKTKVAAAELGPDWIIIFDGSALATTFAALQPGCQYSLRVAARNGAGQGQFSVPLHVTTAPDAPLAPPTPEAVSETKSLLLRWRAPPHDGGAPIVGYKVEMRSGEDQGGSAALGPADSLAIPQHFISIYSGLDMCVQVTDVLPGTRYEFRVAAMNSHGAGPWSPVGSTATKPAAPQAPEPPVVVGSGSSSLSLTWKEPFGQGKEVCSYTLNLARPAHPGQPLQQQQQQQAQQLEQLQQQQLQQQEEQQEEQQDESHDGTAGGGGQAAGAEKLRWETVYSGPLTSAEVKHLKPASHYLLRLRAHNEIGGSPWSEAMAATTGPAAPGAPCGLAAAALSSARVRLSWAPPAEDHGAEVSSYQLEVAGPGAAPGAAWSRAWSGGDCAAEVGGLLPGRAYSWRVRALNACGAGPWCEPAQCRTLAAPPGAPPRPSFSQRTATSVKVNWGMPPESNGAVPSRSLLQLRGGSASASKHAWAQAYDGGELFYRLTGLQPGASYDVRVAAVNVAGAGPWSEASSVTLLLGAAGQPTHVLLASWPAAEPAPAAAEAAGYELEAAPLAGGAPALKATVPRATSATLTGLAPGTTYAVRVRSVGTAGTGHSAWSAAVHVDTPAAPAPPPGGSDGGSDAAPGAIPSAEGGGKRKGRAKAKAAPAEGSPGGGAEKRKGRPAAAASMVLAKKTPPPRRAALRSTWQLVGADWRMAKRFWRAAWRWFVGTVIVILVCWGLAWVAHANSQVTAQARQQRAQAAAPAGMHPTARLGRLQGD